MNRSALRTAVPAVICVALVAAACGRDPLPPADADSIVIEASSASENDGGAAPTPTEPPRTLELDGATADITLDASAAGIAIDPRVFGTNVPAWVRPGKLIDPAFQREAIASGTTLIRMPGGSWSNSYSWSGCEWGDPDDCFWPWAATPSDFAQFMLDTDIPGIWTVSINETAQSAAALVSFFNGDVEDETEIGIDRDGRDWGTVGNWAELRAAKGLVDPVRIELWEVGNEVYGGRPDAGGSECPSFGWEDVWTCDGAEYVVGDDDNDGFLAIREAMLGVDPTIEVGAVGVGEPDEWGNWGNEVIFAAGEALDFYIVHDYGFDESPAPETAVGRAEEMWPTIIDDVRAVLPADVPIAITEYNLISFIDGDTERSMTSAANALFIADTLGQMVTNEIPIANHWNLANGAADTGADYGLISLETNERLPTFSAFAHWTATGDELHPVDDDGELAVYPTLRDDGTWSVIVLNPTDDPIARSFSVDDASSVSVSVETSSAPTLDAQEMTESSTDATALDSDSFELTFTPYSINRVEVTAGG
ncbi:MAG: alpha-L-arabinofuranosidase [Actinomycetota bacterium]